MSINGPLQQKAPTARIRNPEDKRINEFDVEIHLRPMVDFVVIINNVYDENGYKIGPFSFQNGPDLAFSITIEEAKWLLASHFDVVQEKLRLILDHCENGLISEEFKLKRFILETIVSRERIATTIPTTKPTTYGHVYVVKATSTDMFKIGATTASNPRSRISNIQTSCPYPLELYSAFESEDCWLCEKKMHDLLDQFRTIGEWFKCNELAIDAAMDAILGK